MWAGLVISTLVVDTQEIVFPPLYGLLEMSLNASERVYCDCIRCLTHVCGGYRPQSYDRMRRN